MKKFPQSNEILNKIKSSSKILVTSHISPDMDSMGSILSFYQVLKKLEKIEVDVVLTDKVPKTLEFLPFSKDIKQDEIFDLGLSKFDLLIFLDSANLKRVTRKLENQELDKDIHTINIDHHITNENYANINLVEEVSSTSELLFSLYNEWEIDISKDIALCLLTGITGDTGGFQYPTTTSLTHEIAAELVNIGAEPNLIAFNTLKSNHLDKIHFWGLCLSKMKLENLQDKSFVWSAVSFQELEPFGGPEMKEGIEGFFGQVLDTDFGIIIIEQEKGILSGSLRSRTDIDVSKIAIVLGGGGHKGAAGFKFPLNNLSFDDGVNKVQEAIKQVYGN